MSDALPDDAALRRGDVDPQTLVSAGMVAELVVEIRSVVRSIESFARALDIQGRQVVELASLRRRNAVIGVACLVASLGVLVLAGAGAIFLPRTLHRLGDVADSNRANGQLINECVTPSPPPGHATSAADAVHECYEEAAARTAAALAAIQADAVAAAACATEHAGDETAIRSCFHDKLAHPGGTP